MKTLILSVFTILAVTAQPASTTSPDDMRKVRSGTAPAAADPAVPGSVAISARWEAGAPATWRGGGENVLLARTQPLTPGEPASHAPLADTPGGAPLASSESAIGPANSGEAVRIEPSPKVVEPVLEIYPGTSKFIEPMRRPRQKGVFRSNKLWTASVAAHLATTLSDGITSYYLIDVWHLGTENNRIINAFNGGNKATFGVGGFAYKAIWFSAINIPAYYLLKKYGHNNRPLQALFSALNFESSALFTHETLRNAHYMSVLPH